MRRKILYIVSLCLLLFPLSEKLKAQGRDAGWQLSFGGGFMNYYGDLSPYRIHHGSDGQKIFKFFQYNKYYVPEASFGLGLEKRFTPGLGILFQANKGVFAMSDRYRSANGDYDPAAPHWNRALNFKTDVWDAGLALTFHSDNGSFLYSNAFFAPYFFIGGGVTYFKVKGDLYNSDGQAYNYADPDVNPDGKYETDLRPLMTETYKKYAKATPYADLGIGIKLRLSPVVSLTIQSDIKYSFSDYLDDVSGKYKLQYVSEEQFYAAHPGTNAIGHERRRGYADGINDFYIFNKAAIQFSLGGRSARSRFKAPIVYNPGLLRPSDTLSRRMQDSLDHMHNRDSLRALQTADSLKRLHAGSSALDSIQNTLQQLRTEMQSLRFTRIDQDYLIRQNAIRYKTNSLEEKKRELENHSYITKADSLQILRYQAKIDSLEIQWQAIQGAREQLRAELGNTPVITEYKDSTKIIIYKENKLSSDNRQIFDTGSSNHKASDLYKKGDSSKEDRRRLNGLQYKYNAENKRSDSLRLLYLQRALDSIYQDRDTFRDRYNFPDRDTGEISPSYIERLREGHFSERGEMDSLRVSQLQHSLDSITRIQQSLNAEYHQDSIAAEERDGNIFQRLLNKIRKNDRYHEDLQEITAEQKKQLKDNQEEIDRLQEELRRLRNNSQRYFIPSPYGNNYRDSREMRNLERAVNDLYREQTRRRRRGDLEIVPRIAPTIVTGAGHNNKNYDRELEAIRRRLDTLQLEKSASPDSSDYSDKVISLQNQLDSLQDLTARQQRTQKETQITTLRQQVDSLTQQIALIRKQQTITDSQRVKASLSNFPVISVYFATGSSTLNKDQIEKLRPAAAVVKKHEGVAILLESFTDATGGARINKIISEKRSRSVKEAFTNMFDIPSSRIKIKTGGQTNTGQGSNPMQRRVDVRLETARAVQ